MKIALIQAPGWGRDCPPYTMALLSAIAREAGHKTYCFDINNSLYCSGPDKYRSCWDDKDLYNFWSSAALINQFLEDNKLMLNYQIDQILKTGSRIVGFTVHFSSSIVSLAIARRIKLADPSRIIVFGGPDCSKTLRGKEYIKEDCVDVVGTGEGDYLLLEIADQLHTKGEIEFIKGALIAKNGKVIDCGEADLIDNLDSLPFPDYSDFANDINAGFYREPERLDIFDSRGCVNRCHFCSEWQFWRRFRFMSGERIFAEIKHQMHLYPKVDRFYFIGSLLNGDIKALSRFCDLVIDNGIKLRWSGQPIIRPEMTKALLEKMRKAGCEWLGYGIESGSEELLHRMNKRFSVKVAERVLEDTHNAGIGVQANFMFGMPTETESDFAKTIDFLKSNRTHIDSILASQSFCVLDKGTYLYNHPEEFNIKDRDHHLYWESGKENNYTERFHRYEEFCKRALSMGLPEDSGLLKEKPDKWKLLGEYYLYKKDYKQGADYLNTASAKDPKNTDLHEKLQTCLNNLHSTQHKKDNDAVTESKIDYSQDLEQLSLDSTQLQIAKTMRDKGLTEKLKNFLLVEEQKLLRTEYVNGYPYWLTLDPSNLCNLQCPFCPTGQRRGSRTKGMMSYDNFKKIMHKLGKHLIHIDFCNWGEPFTNKDIFKMISLAKEYDIDTKIDSNFTLLSESDIDKLLQSGIDKIVVSIDGLCQETYAKYRVGGDFNKAMSNLSLLLRRKKQLNLNKPHIAWQFLVFKHNEHEVDQVKRLGQEMGVDETAITNAFIGYKDWMPTKKEYCNYNIDTIDEGSDPSEKTSDYLKNQGKGLCNWPWEAITINVNGSVSPCCSVEDEKDDFDNIFDNNFDFNAIWNGNKYRQARRHIRSQEGDCDGQNHICYDCSHSGLININLLGTRALIDDHVSVLIDNKDLLKTRDHVSGISIAEKNLKLNKQEICEQKVVLESNPTSLMAILTTECNINCIMCGRRTLGQTLPYDTIKKVFSLFPYLKRVDYQGGEVFLLNYFKEVFSKTAEHQNILQHITTNGLLIDSEWAKLFAQARTSLQYSIDAVTKTTYESIRRGGQFKSLIRSLELVRDANKKYAGATEVGLNAVVMRRNYKELYLFPDFCKRYGISQITFDLLLPGTTTQAKRSLSIGMKML